MVWIFPIAFTYVVCIITNSWGGWCILSCFSSVIIVLIIGNYYNYYLLSEWFGLDQFSIILILLCFLVLRTRLVCSFKDVKTRENFFDKKRSRVVELVVLISLGRVLFFSLASWIDFYFFFEFSLVPTFWLILKWGYQPERIQAGLYILMYTASASLPLLVGLVMFWLTVGSDNILLFKCLGVGSIWKNFYLVWLFISLGFLVKLPIYFFHGWLPQAHVEAPLAGSILLAGVLLKFGAYGIVRLIWITDRVINSVVLMILCFCLWGGVLAGCICVAQSDLKALIAFTSIAHIAVCMSGVLRIYSLGKLSGVCLFFAHGLSSPLTFALAARNYDSVGTRNVVMRGGVLQIFPLFAFLWIFAAFLNMGLPPSLNFFREIYTIVTLNFFHPAFRIPRFLLVFLSACYSLIFYSWLSHRSISELITPVGGLSCRYIYRGVFLISILFLGVVSLDFVFV